MLDIGSNRRTSRISLRSRYFQVEGAKRRLSDSLGPTRELTDVMSRQFGGCGSLVKCHRRFERQYPFGLDWTNSCTLSVVILKFRFILGVPCLVRN